MDKSNLQVASNLMIDDDHHKPEYQYLPGDYVGQIYAQYVDPAISAKYLTKRQLVELEQYLPCLICGKACAGTCQV
ncbi:MAG: hypothetical protein ACHQQQ_13670 [Bacteroidota bacterium]